MIIAIIVGAIVISVIIQIYSALHNNYLKTSSIARLESISINTMLIIENYLHQSIKESISIRDNNQILPLQSILNQNEFIWLNQSIESRQNSNSKFNWSGFVDINSINISQDAITLLSPLSNYNAKSKDAILNNLKFSNEDMRVIFKGDDNCHHSWSDCDKCNNTDI